MAAGDDEGGFDFTGWAPLVGRWAETTSDVARFVGSADPAETIGLLIGPEELGLTAGMLSVHARFPVDEEPEPQGRIVFGFNPRGADFYSAGLGGYRALYTIERYIPGE